jgi:uncharacterized membrane protein YuzA (DUF378 family)
VRKKTSEGQAKKLADMLAERKETRKDEATSTDKVATGLLLVGVLNWMSVSLLNFDLIQAAAGRSSIWGRLAYGAIGASAFYVVARGAQMVKQS